MARIYFKKVYRKEERNMTSGMITKKDLENKYIFWDVDGTLAAYRFNNHVADPDGTDNGMSLKEIEDGVFLKRKPSLFMQKVLNQCSAKENIIMGHSRNKKEMEDKQKWLNKYYPNIKNRILVLESFSKAECMIKYSKSNKIKLEDIVYIDDVIGFLREAERKGIQSWHISSFLDWEFN